MDCMIHRQALSSKTLPTLLQSTLDEIIQVVNFIEGSALNSRLFKQPCEGMDANHQLLLYHTKVCWLSKGNVTKRVIELRDELNLFFQESSMLEFLSWLNDAEWIIRLGYLTDIFGQLNKLNLQMQGRNTNIIKFVDCLKAFIDKLGNWKRKVAVKNVGTFENLDMILVENSNQIPSSIQLAITAHLKRLEEKFRSYSLK
ncbi:zinc finger BED domain-containing protein 5-like [Watersipora subatra]|uniref:zinc finger BED domain-containing protein 5-like n=1 Tax=Watersipora subatra TaxID=2589382 RepID=UPI00355C0CEB